MSEWYAKVVDQLIDAGANVNQVQSDYGFTALRGAKDYGHVKIIERLIAAGAKE